MKVALARNWWSLLIRGLLGILIGVLAFLWPHITIAALVLLFGAYALIDGVLHVVGAVNAAQKNERWGVHLIAGIMGIVAGVITFFWPAITTFALVYLIAAWAVMVGIFDILTAIKLRKHIDHEWLLALSGVASLVFGVLIFFAPVAGAVAIALWVGIYAFFSGAVLIALAFRLRSWEHHHLPGGPMPLPAH
jgi:uncharacterized membrane protein HdeD (DUF308 family)